MSSEEFVLVGCSEASEKEFHEGGDDGVSTIEHAVDRHAFDHPSEGTDKDLGDHNRRELFESARLDPVANDLLDGAGGPLLSFQFSF